jgi:hypothetical protein
LKSKKLFIIKWSLHSRREDGTKWEYAYNIRSEVTSAIKTTANSQLVPGLSFAYNFDGMGNRITSTTGTAPNVSAQRMGIARFWPGEHW